MTQAIFLSYASQDADAARRVCEALRGKGLEVWFDQSELRGGDAWDASIRKQIRECALFVPFISANTNAREEGYFRLEWKLAVDRTHLMSETKPFLFPVLLEGCMESGAVVPDAFRARQWSRVDDEAAIEAFAGRVAGVLPASPSSPSNRNEGTSPSPPPPNAPPRGRKQGNHRMPWLGAGAALLVAAAAAAAFVATSLDRERKQRFVTEGVSRLADLGRSGKFMEAFLLAHEIEAAGGEDNLTQTVREGYSRAVHVTSTPPGAKIELRPYDPQRGDGAWQSLGSAPLDGLRVPRGVMEWQATMPDGAVHRLVTAATPNKRLAFSPQREGTDGGQVAVTAGTISIGGLVGLRVAQDVKLGAFQIDRLEVRNRDYARFVAAGGYAREELWPIPFIQGTRKLSFGEAMNRFKDATGRPGPAHWKLGSFADGEGDLPVRGVSWYEAAAYARFAGKELPTLYHWYRADTDDDFGLVLPTVFPSANFGGKGPRASSSSRTIGPFGATDMAGNVREWVATPTDKGQRMALGGSWEEVYYQYKYATPYSPWARMDDVGFRCMKRIDDTPDDIAQASVVERPLRAGVAHKPISEAEYAVYTRFFERSRVPLDVRAEPGVSSSSYWTRTKVSYAAGYGNERMSAYLYLPKNARPPYQTVIFMHGSGVFNLNKPYEQVGETAEGFWITPEMLVRGGRALLVPIWKGSYERHAKFEWTRGYFRERLPQWVGEMQRSVDFLHTRSELDKSRIGYFGFSHGAMWAPNMLAMEPRVGAAVLLAGGLEGVLPDGDFLTPELDAATYAPRVKSAVLMVNGRSDIRFPYETSQVPLFQLLGSPPGKKVHKTYPVGHSTFGWFNDMARDTHDWFDQQFGVVAPAAGK